MVQPMHNVCVTSKCIHHTPSLSIIITNRICDIKNNILLHFIVKRYSYGLTASVLTPPILPFLINSPLWPSVTVGDHFSCTQEGHCPSPINCRQVQAVWSGQSCDIVHPPLTAPTWPCRQTQGVWSGQSCDKKC